MLIKFVDKGDKPSSFIVLFQVKSRNVLHQNNRKLLSNGSIVCCSNVALTQLLKGKSAYESFRMSTMHSNMLETDRDYPEIEKTIEYKQGKDYIEYKH